MTRKLDTLVEEADPTTVGVAEFDREACYRVLHTRDARFDGRFYIAVITTGIYCRPVCPATPPKIDNCIFLPSAGAAHQLGFRPCLRCRPELTPGIASWNGSASTVSRALRLIGEGGLTDASLEQFAERLGVGARHLRRLFHRHLGASPGSVAQAQRILFAKKLISETSLSMTEVALAAGFGSIRRFNDAFKKTYGRAPSRLRQSPHEQAPNADGITLRLPFHSPYDWPAMIAILQAHAIGRVEQVSDGRYCRTFSIGGAQGLVQVRHVTGQSYLLASIRISDVAALGAVVMRLRRVFDLDANIAAIDAHLLRDAVLAPMVCSRPGIRVPGAWNNFELAARAVLGQQITPTEATALATRLAAASGQRLENIQAAASEPDLLFPEPKDIAAEQLRRIGLARARAQSLQGLAAAMAADGNFLRSYGTLQETIAKLCGLPGIDPQTAEYITMRALREPDAFPVTDSMLSQAMASGRGRPSPTDLLKIAEPWRPWRAYAAVRLRLQSAQPSA